MQAETESALGPKLSILTAEEIDRCLLLMTDTQHRAIFTLMSELGLTTSEMLGDESLGLRGLYIQDFDSRGMTIKVQSRFKREDRITTRIVPMTSHVIVAVRDFLVSKNLCLHDFGKLFDITDRMVRYFIAGLEEKSDINKSIDTAMLRRTAIVKMLRGGLKPVEIEKRLGFIRPQEKVIFVVSEYFMPDLTDYERVVNDFLFEHMSAVSGNIRGPQN
jgi:site-specific recombinase XerD